MNTYQTLFMSALLCLFLGSGAVRAEVSDSSDFAQHGTMTPQEYETYRNQLQHQIEQANPPMQNKTDESNAKEVAPDQSAKQRSGYGQGYRARAERSDRAARMNGNRGGAMNSGGMHRR